MTVSFQEQAPSVYNCVIVTALSWGQTECMLVKTALHGQTVFMRWWWWWGVSGLEFHSEPTSHHKDELLAQLGEMTICYKVVSFKLMP